MIKKKRVEIVTPVHNRRDITLQCLRSLARLKTENLEVHTIIVDDGSTDGTGASIERDFPNVEVVKGDGNLWFTEGTNVGMRVALEHQPDYVLLINDDSVFDENFLEFMVETAEKYPRSIIGPLLLLWDVPHKLFQVAPSWKTFAGGWRWWDEQTIWSVPDRTWEVEIIVGNCVLIPTAAIREHGLMNSARYPNFGDIEYTPRLRKNGWRLLIDPRARVFCQPNEVAPKFAQKTLAEKIKAMFFDLKHPQSLRRYFYAYLDTAPNKAEAVVAYSIFLMRLALIKTGLKKTTDEKNLRTILEKSVVEN